MGASTPKNGTIPFFRGQNDGIIPFLHPISNRIIPFSYTKKHGIIPKNLYNKLKKQHVDKNTPDTADLVIPEVVLPE